MLRRRATRSRGEQYSLTAVLSNHNNWYFCGSSTWESIEKHYKETSHRFGASLLCGVDLFRAYLMLRMMRITWHVWKGAPYCRLHLASVIPALGADTAV